MNADLGDAAPIAEAMPPAGWYADPNDAAGQRWWDGQQWTDFVQPVAPAVQPVETAPQAQRWTVQADEAPVSDGFGAPGLSLPPAEPSRRGRGRLVAGVAAGVAVAVAATVTLLFVPHDGKPPAAAAAILTAVGSGTLSVSGSMSLHDDSLAIYSSGCAGEGGYDDIADGAAVTITDAGGAIVGLGRLAGSQAVTSTECDLSFVVSDVPAGKGFYGVEVSHRGSVKYAEADLASPIELTLGS